MRRWIPLSIDGALERNNENKREVTKHALDIENRTARSRKIHTSWYSSISSALSSTRVGGRRRAIFEVICNRSDDYRTLFRFCRQSERTATRSNRCFGLIDYAPSIAGFGTNN